MIIIPINNKIDKILVYKSLTYKIAIKFIKLDIINLI